MTLILPIPATPVQPKLPDQPVPPQPSSVPRPPPMTSTFTCSFCNVRFNEQSVLIAHLSSHVTFTTPPSDEDIDKGYFTFSVMGGQRTKSMCLFCGKTFNKEPQVKIHLNVHNGDNIYNCRFCEKVFANYSTFEVSLKLSSQKLFRLI
jgi:hypothetical protein